MSEILGYLLGESWWRRRARRRALERLECGGPVDSGLRVVEGSVRGLSREWMHGNWGVSPGLLTHLSTVVDVLEVEDDFQKPTFRESWGVDPDADIVVLRCRSGRAEWALPPGCREAALRRVTPPPSAD